ncbi:hypothetical protein [Baaleninema sp.]|uniref:hypothetical protein n=1 Tax=Baaleninema sp. TaxID=3101197 RepID=UPI003D06159E
MPTDPPSRPTHPNSPIDSKAIPQFEGTIYRLTNPTQIITEPSNIDLHRSLRSLVVSRHTSGGYPVIRKLS